MRATPKGEPDRAKHQKMPRAQGVCSNHLCKGLQGKAGTSVRLSLKVDLEHKWRGYGLNFQFVPTYHTPFLPVLPLQLRFVRDIVAGCESFQ